MWVYFDFTGHIHVQQPPRYGHHHWATATKLPAHCSVPTYQRPLSDADPHAVHCTGGELGPVGQLAVVLAGQLTRLRDAGHGLGELQTRGHLSLGPI